MHTLYGPGSHRPMLGQSSVTFPSGFPHVATIQPSSAVSNALQSERQDDSLALLRCWYYMYNPQAQLRESGDQSRGNPQSDIAKDFALQ